MRSTPSVCVGAAPATCASSSASRAPGAPIREAGGAEPPSRAVFDWSFRLYIVTRADLAPGLQCAQACHTLRAFVAEHPELERAWYEQSNTLVVLEVPDESALAALEARARALGAPVAAFREPDLDDALTGVALGPGSGAWRLVSSLPLALKKSRQ